MANKSAFTAKITAYLLGLAALSGVGAYHFSGSAAADNAYKTCVDAFSVDPNDPTPSIEEMCAARADDARADARVLGL